MYRENIKPAKLFVICAAATNCRVFIRFAFLIFDEYSLFLKCKSKNQILRIELKQKKIAKGIQFDQNNLFKMFKCLNTA